VTLAKEILLQDRNGRNLYGRLRFLRWNYIFIAFLIRQMALHTESIFCLKYKTLIWIEVNDVTNYQLSIKLLI